MSNVACNIRESCPDAEGCHGAIPHTRHGNCGKCSKYGDVKCVPLKVYEIKIVKCPKHNDWYRDKIGHTYEVTNHHQEPFHRYPPWKGEYWALVGKDMFFRKDDCVLLQEEPLRGEL
jgi:hypothetical protein